MSPEFLAVASSYWPLIRYNPELRRAGKKPFVLDSPTPTMKVKDYAYTEMRYKLLQRSHPKEAKRLMKLAQESVDLRWSTYEHMAEQDPSEFQPVE